ncbi:pigment-dispersing hormone type 2-like [Uranotaenia lowii]|uniref:pigment-dispersing hormone type 2-like n=1 Tax=Uranotaenia lowii TaxID=190385 RepID=UPI00247A2B88|nr:pigment-dispersing hormone type 2-like [Uranotaenia lowii]
MADKFTLCFLVICMCLRMSLAMPSYDDDRIGLEKDQYLRQVQDLLADPSPYLIFSQNPYAKRNSELINTLLGLPKKLEEAGK